MQISKYTEKHMTHRVDRYSNVQFSIMYFMQMFSIAEFVTRFLFCPMSLLVF